MLMNIQTKSTVMPNVTEILRLLSKCLGYLPQRHKHFLNSSYIIYFSFFLTSRGVANIKVHLYFRVFLCSLQHGWLVFSKGSARLAWLGPRQSRECWLIEVFQCCLAKQDSQSLGRAWQLSHHEWE